MIDYPQDFFCMGVHNNFYEELEKYCALADQTLRKLGLDPELSLDETAPPIAVEAEGVLRLRAQLNTIQAWELVPLLDQVTGNLRPTLSLYIVQLMELAMRVGALGERLKARPHETNAARGKKVIEAARQGHEQTHGTPEEKRLRNNKLQVEVDRISSWNSKAKKTSIAKRVARKFKVNYKTVIRNTTLGK